VQERITLRRAQGTQGNDRKKGKSQGKCEYRGSFASLEDDEILGGVGRKSLGGVEVDEAGEEDQG